MIMIMIVMMILMWRAFLFLQYNIGYIEFTDPSVLTTFLRGCITIKLVFLK